MKHLEKEDKKLKDHAKSKDFTLYEFYSFQQDNNIRLLSFSQ